MKSIRLKLVILYITLVFIVMIVSGTTMLVMLRQNEVEKGKEKLFQATTIIMDEVLATTSEPKDFAEKLEGLFKTEDPGLQISSEIQAFILTPKGLVQTSAKKSIDYKLPIDRVIIEAMSGEESFSSNVQGIDFDDGTKTWLEYARPYKENDQGEMKYIVFVRADAEKILEALSIMTDILLIASVGALLLTAVIGFLFADTLTAPIKRLIKKSNELAVGKTYKEIPVSSQDELGQLTKSFNYMGQELSTMISNIESEKSKLEILLHNMTDGVLAYDTEGTLVHANSMCYEILEIETIEELTFSEIVKRLELPIEGSEDLEGNTILESTVALKEKYVSAIFSSYANQYGTIEGMVVVLQDVTKHKKLDNMRKEFVANVSHEIRTPLTTIKGYTETLLDGALEDTALAENFLKVIEGEADRMTLLVADLLELSRFDNQQLKIDVTEIDLMSITREVIIQNKLSAEKKKQQLVFTSSMPDAIVFGDRGRIIQVFTNIISNAIKYSADIGTISISIQETDQTYSVAVQDTGLGIPKEDLTHIFERFYRVDKARSRAMGGTGLGLSIAKEIMEAHNGRIAATSEMGVGTKITLTFDKSFGMQENNS